MAQVYFHCASGQGTLISRQGLEMSDLAEAYDHAVSLVRVLVTLPTLEDWRDWAIRVSDDLDQEVFVVSFASVLGKPH